MPRRDKPFDRKRDIAGLGIGAVAEERVDFAADHHADDAVDVCLCDISAADEAPVAQHSVAVADLEHLFEAVGHEDDAQPFRFEVADDAEELFDLDAAERGGRLVHDDEARLHGKSARDLDHLLFRDGEIADEAHRIGVEPDPFGDGARLGGHLSPVDEKPSIQARGR